MKKKYYDNILINWMKKKYYEQYSYNLNEKEILRTIFL